MNISITGPPETTNKRFQKSARRQLIRAFGNYSGSIVGIKAELSDVKSEQHGLQRHCRIAMQMLGFECVTAEAWDDNLLAAVIRAADRGRQNMFSQFNRQWRQVV